MKRSSKRSIIRGVSSPEWILALVATTALGLSAGANLTEAVLYVPYWRLMPPADFLAWFAVNEPHLVAFFGPLQAATAALALAAAGYHAYLRRRGAAMFAVAAALSVSVLLLFFVYFRDVNAAFVAGTVAADAVPTELARWGAWHWLRTAVGTAAFVAALVAITASTTRPDATLEG